MPLSVLNDPGKPPKAAADATAVEPTKKLSLADRVSAFLNWTDPFPYRPRPQSPANPHAPPPDADAIEREMRSKQAPISADMIAALMMGKK